VFLILALFFSGCFIVLELFRVSKYTSRLLAFIPMFLLLIMIGFNRMNRDYQSYEYAFLNEYHRESFDFGFAFLVTALENIGMGHEALVFITGALLIFVVIKKLNTSNSINLVIFFYCLFPLIFDINQIRNLFMYLIIILSLTFIENNKPIKFFILWFLAFSMHKLALVYLLFYFLCKKSRKWFVSKIRLLLILSGIASPLIMLMLGRIFPEKIAIYLANPPKLGVIVIFVYVIIDIFTVWWVDKRIYSRMPEEDKGKMEILYRFVWFPVLILPFAFYFIEVSRLQRNALLVKYIYCALAMKYLKFKEKLFVIFLLLLSISVYIVMLVYNNQLELFQYLDENILKYYLGKYY